MDPNSISLIFNVLMIGLLVALVVTFIKYPLQILKGIFHWFIPDWVRPTDDNQSEEPYSSTKNLKFNFGDGTKLISVQADKQDSSDQLNGFIEFSEGQFQLEDFEFKSEELIQCPKGISFYDFNLLTQHFCNRFKNARGIFNSLELSYYLYQDSSTVHNLVGQTKSGDKFSIYTLDDLNKKVYLKINNKLAVVDFELSINGI